MTIQEIWGACAAGLVLLVGIWALVAITCAIGVIGVIACAWVTDMLRQPRHRASVRDLLQEEAEGIWEQEPAAPVPAVVLPDRCPSGRHRTPDLTPEELLWWVPVPSQRTGCTTGGDDALTPEQLDELADTVLGALGASQHHACRRGSHGTPAEAAALAAADDASAASEWTWVERPGCPQVVDLGEVQEDIGKGAGDGGSRWTIDGDGR